MSKLNNRSSFDTGDDEYGVMYDVKVVRSTELAGLFRINGTEHWLPWSQVREDSVDRDGHTGTLYVQAWLLDERGIDYDV